MLYLLFEGRIAIIPSNLMKIFFLPFFLKGKDFLKDKEQENSEEDRRVKAVAHPARDKMIKRATINK